MTVDGKEKILVEGEPPSRHPILYYGAEIFTLAAFFMFFLSTGGHGARPGWGIGLNQKARQDYAQDGPEQVIDKVPGIEPVTNEDATEGIGPDPLQPRVVAQL